MTWQWIYNTTWLRHCVESLDSLITLCEEKPLVTVGAPSQKASKSEFWCVYKARLYNENAWVCVKWQWNARDCVTGLRDRRSRECNPVTPVECISLSFNTHLWVLAFITHTLCINGIEMTFVWLIQYTLRYIFFIFTICFIVLMNLGETYHFPFKETRLGDGVANNAVARLLPLMGQFDWPNRGE